MNIFVSHATKDREIVNRLIDLLVKGAGVALRDIFCTSAVGLGVANGEEFVREILTKLDKAELIIAVLSQSFFESPFRIAEVGAAQIRKRIKKNVTFHALLVPPADYSTHLGGVLYGAQAGKINAGETIDELKDRIPNVPTPTWNVQRTLFLEEVSAIIDRAQTASLLDKVTVTNTEFDFPTKDAILYTRKLRVYLRNDTNRLIQLANPVWHPDIAGTDVQYPYLSLYQRLIGKKWDSAEPQSIELRPGDEARLWLGLDPNKTPVELRMLHANRRMGTLEIPATIGGVQGSIRRKM